MREPTENRESARRTFAVSALRADITLSALGGDASYRRYYRVQDGDRSYILMDAPPEHGGVALFQERSAQFRACRLPVPQIHAADSAQGFLLLEDYGDRWLYHDLVAAPEAAMTQAFALLGDWQQATANLRDAIPPYETARLNTEVALMREWFLPWLGIHADSAPLQALETRLAEEVSDNAVCVHRDYHCRNLMRCNDGRIGILDYQDALWGHPAYDLVSLTRDCYLRYPSADVRRWEETFRVRHHPAIAAQDWARACDAVALQRHLKVLGLFVRLASRDGKSGYLADLPRVLAYAHDEAAALAEYAALATLLKEAVPLLHKKLAS